MPYHIAAIDVHKKMSAVAVADVEVEGDYQFERLKECTAWPKCPAWAPIPRGRSSRKSVPVPRRFRQRNSSRPGWAHAPATRRVAASTTVTAALTAIDRCGASSIRRTPVNAKGTIFAVV